MQQRRNLMKLNFEGLKMQKWNILTDGDLGWEKWGQLFSYHVYSRVIVIKMSKMAHFLYFLLTPKPIILKELDKIFQMHLNILPKLWLIFWN